MPEQVGCCDNQPFSSRISGSKGDERPDVLCPKADASSISLPLTFPNLLLVVEDDTVRDFDVFCATVGDEQTVLLVMPGFVYQDITSFL